MPRLGTNLKLENALMLGKAYLADREIKKAETSLSAFIKVAWPIIEPGTPFVSGRHIDAISEHLEACHKRQIRKLIINLPPRHMKSSIMAVMFPAWVWITRPEEKFLFSSYDLKLSYRDSRKCRMLIKSPWFQKHWADRFQIVKDQDEKRRFDNNKMGYRVATSTDAGTTGEGASVICVDDGNDVKKMTSQAYIDSVFEYNDQVLATRLNDARTGVRIHIQQRCSEQDLTGHILERETGWDHLVLPCEYEGPSKVTSIGWKDWRTKPGELLWPERFPRAEVEDIKRTLGPMGVAGQLQQRPAPAEGATFKREWFRYYNEPGETTKAVKIETQPGKYIEREPITLPVAFEQLAWGIDCLDSQTEILTSDGWRGRGQVTAGDLVYSLNLTTGELELTPAECYGERPMREGERFARIFSQQIDIRVTEGHTFPIYTIHGAHRESVARTLTGAQLIDRKGKYKLRLSEEYPYPGVALTDDELRFIAWFITDGGFGNQYVQISQAKEYKHEIRDLLNRLGFSFIERKVIRKTGFPNGKDFSRFCIPKGTKTGKYKRSGWVHLAPYLDKNISPLLLQMTKAQFGVFWDELLKGDGTKRRLCCGRTLQADRLQAMAVTRGYSSSIHRRLSNFGTLISYIRCGNRRTIESNAAEAQYARIGFESPSNDEIVWCVQNQNSTLVTRRGGRVAILGNCAFKDGKENDLTAIHVWGRVGSNVFLLHRRTGRWDFPRLQREIREVNVDFNCPEKMIENKANGPAIIQSLKNEISGMIESPIDGGLIALAGSLTGYAEAGNVYFPNPDLHPWVRELIEQYAMFPNGKHDDDIAAASHAQRRLFDAASNSGVPEFRVVPRIGEPENASHVKPDSEIAAEIEPIWRRWIAISPGQLGAALWICETPTKALRVYRELSLDGIDAHEAGRQIAEMSMPDVTAFMKLMNARAKWNIQFLMEKAAFEPVEPIGSYAELLEDGILSYESTSDSWIERQETKEKMKLAKFTSEMTEIEDGSIDRLRDLLRFSPPDFKQVPYDRRKAIALADKDAYQYNSYISAVEGKVFGEWPKIKIAASCKGVIRALGGFRRTEDATDHFLRALLIGASAPANALMTQKVPQDAPYPFAAPQGNGRSRMARRFGRRVA